MICGRSSQRLVEWDGRVALWESRELPEACQNILISASLFEVNKE
jgi:hypothetical protein